MGNQFLVSVANAIGRDPTTGNVLFLGKANISSAFNITMAKTDVRGGINNPLLYAYYHDRAVDVKIEQATFTESIIALNAGTSVLNASVTVVKNEGIQLSSGSGFVSQTPTAGTNIGVVFSNGAIQTVTPTSGSFFVASGSNQAVDVVYTYSVVADQIVGYTTKPPTAIDLTLISEVRDTNNNVVTYLQVNIPHYAVSGNYVMSMAANGVSNQALDGQALSTLDPINGDYYYKITWIDNTGNGVAYTQIAAAPGVVSFSNALKPQTQQLSVLGIRGGPNLDVNLTSLCTYVKTSGSPGLTISGSGLITSASSVAAGYGALFTVTYWDATSGSLTDGVFATVGA